MQAVTPVPHEARIGLSNEISVTKSLEIFRLFYRKIRLWNSFFQVEIVYLLVQTVSSGLLLVTVFEKQNQTTAERISLPHINSEDKMQQRKWKKETSSQEFTGYLRIRDTLASRDMTTSYSLTGFWSRTIKPTSTVIIDLAKAFQQKQVIALQIIVPGFGTCVYVLICLILHIVLHLWIDQKPSIQIYSIKAEVDS